MQENTNRAIFINSIILYIRLVFTAVCGLLTTRFALQALGVDDFGVFSVVGSVISFIAVINTIMLSTSNRFIATAIGKKDDQLINDTFNVNLSIHVAIAILTMILAIPLGEWYIRNYINYSGSIENVLLVYRITVIGSVISFVGVPYNGLLLAKERFIVFCSTDVVSNIIKLFVSYLLISCFSSKLTIYASTICFCTAFPTLIFWWYCKRIFPEYVKFRVVRKKSMYKEVFGFSVWVGYGAIATVGKSQGAAVIVNMFFNTVMNTALGLANSVNSILLTFANNVTKSIAPQIVKSYSAGDFKRSEDLVIMSSKVSFLIMLLVSSPFLIAPELLFNIWLDSVPDHVVVFTTLIIIDALIGTLNAGIPELIFATGKIRNYQVILNTVFLLSVFAAFFVLKTGVPAFYLLVTYIGFSVIALIIRQVVLNKVVRFNNRRLFFESYFPCIQIVLFFTPFIFIKQFLGTWSALALGVLYLAILIFLLGLNTKERSLIIERVKKIY